MDLKAREAILADPLDQSAEHSISAPPSSSCAETGTPFHAPKELNPTGIVTLQVDNVSRVEISNSSKTIEFFCANVRFRMDTAALFFPSSMKTKNLYRPFFPGTRIPDPAFYEIRNLVLSINRHIKWYKSPDVGYSWKASQECSWNQPFDPKKITHNQYNSFHPFPRLPRELRNLIWAFFLPTTPRIYQKTSVFNWEQNGSVDQLSQRFPCRILFPSRKAPPPTILHVNRESRTEGSRFYKRPFGSISQCSAVVDLSHDYILVSCWIHDFFTVEGDLVSSAEWLQSVQRLVSKLLFLAIHNFSSGLLRSFSINQEQF